MCLVTKQARAEAAKAKLKKVAIKADDSWLSKSSKNRPSSPSPPPIPARSPLRALYQGVPIANDSNRFSTAPGYFATPQAEEQARRDLTPAALRIIQRRELIEARKSDIPISKSHPDSSRSSPASIPGYYEDTNFIPSNFFVPDRVPEQATELGLATKPEPRLNPLTIHQLLSAQSFSEIPVPDDPEEAKCLERAWTLKQRKISSNYLDNLPADHGLTELFARFRIPHEED
jgi:hypothetical protein